MRVFLVSVFLTPIVLFGQDDFMAYDDASLDKHFKAWDLVGFDMSQCFVEEIDRTLTSALKHDASLSYTWDSLQNHVSVQTSADGNFRSYSYDRRMGGNWHDYSVFIQMRMSDSSIQTLQVDTDRAAEFGTYEDAGIYEVHAIKIKDSTHYLTLAYGTHESGEHHVTARVYGERNGKMVSKPLFAQEHLVVTAQRSYKFDMKYNATTKELSYNEMISQDDSPWNSPTGKRTIWKLEKDGFQPHH